MRRLVGYIRVSRKNGRSGERYLSPTMQREAIEQWAKRVPGVQIVDWVTEEDRSGDEGKRRPEFEQLLERIETGNVQGIAVWKFSRFGRSLIESALRIRDIDQAGGVVESATEGAQSKLTRHIMLAIAEDELDRLKETWSYAQERAIARGVWIGAAPLGYRRNAAGRLSVDPKLGPVVSEAFERAAAGGLHEAIAYLSHTVPSRAWSTDSVRKLLRTRTYLGENGKRGLEGGYEPHPALTTEATYAAAQSAPRGRRENGDYPLSGVAVCAACGQPLHGQLQTVGERSYRRYRCSNRSCGGGSSIGADALESYVRDTLRSALAGGTFADFEPSAEALALQALRDAETELERFIEIVPATSRAFAKGYAKREAELQSAQAAYSSAAGQGARSRSLPMADELDDPAQFQRALAVLQSIGPVPAVSRGRGSIDDRVSWRALDPDDMSGQLAA